jgi:putative flippase GtrA
MTAPGQFLKQYRTTSSLYLFVGLGSAFVEWSIFYGSLLAGLHPVGAAGIAFAVATAVNYLLSATFVFQSRGRSRREELLLTYLVSAGAMAFNFAVTAALITLFALSGAKIGMLAAKIAGSGTGFVLNYLGRQFFVFRSESEPKPLWNPTGSAGSTGGAKSLAEQAHPL